MFPVPVMRGLPFPVDNSASNSSSVAGEPDCSGSPAFVFPDNPDELTLIPFLLSLNEYNMLASCVDVGADIAYSTDAQRVLYVWLRNTRCGEMICDFMKGCTVEALGSVFGPSQYNEIQAIAAVLQARYAADYTGTPSSINPDTFDTNFDGSGSADDDTVLCSASEAFVKMFAAQKSQQLKLVYGSAAAMLGLTTLLVPGLGWILASGIYLAIGAATLITGVTYAAAIAALESDEQALINVACCLKDSLVGIAVTEANWNAALTGCSFLPASNEEIVQGFVLEALAGNYLTFLDLLGTAKHSQDNGEPVECGCSAIVPNISLIETYPGVVVNNPTFLYNTAAGSVWEATYFFYGGQYAIALDAQIGGIDTEMKLISATPVTSYASRDGMGTVFTGSGDGASPPDWDSIGLYYSGAVVATIEVEPA